MRGNAKIPNTGEQAQRSTATKAQTPQAQATRTRATQSPQARVTRRKRTAVITGTSVENFTASIIRVVAILVLALGFVGSAFAINNNADGVVASLPYFWNGVNPLAAGASLIIQAYLSIVQLHMRRRRLSIVYLTHLGADAWLNYQGFGWIVVPFLVPGLMGLGLDPVGATRAAYFMMIGIALGIALMPEQVLIDD